MTEQLTSNRMIQAAIVAKKLEDTGLRVLNVWHNGRQPVLLLDRAPSGQRGAFIRRQPVTGGFARIMAAPYDGLQIQWLEHEALRATVAHG